MKNLVKHLKKLGVLKTARLEAAFLANDRKNFVPESESAMAYQDTALPIGAGQTISQPYTVAFMMELLQPLPGQKILDVGFGSGWTTAILARAAGQSGKVFGFEIMPELFEFGQSNLQNTRYKNISLYSKSAKDGLPEHAPFDRILVSAAASEVPKELIRELAVGGRMVIPIGPAAWWQGQSLKVVKKVSAEKIETEDYPGFAFVPFVVE